MFMLELSDDQWDELFDKVDQTVTKAQDDLPEEVRTKAESIAVIVDRYQWKIEQWNNMKVLGCYMSWMNGPIAIFAGQIYEDCGQDMDAAMASVRQIYYHELAHAIGDLAEYEVKERGL
jgi:predicted Zn-dependent protease with MMP-like domain